MVCQGEYSSSFFQKIRPDATYHNYADASKNLNINQTFEFPQILELWLNDWTNSLICSQPPQ